MGYRSSGSVWSVVCAFPCTGTTQLSRVAADDFDREIKEADLPGAVFGLLDADGFARKRAANVDQIPLPFDLAVGSHLADRRLGWISWLGSFLGIARTEG